MPILIINDFSPTSSQNRLTHPLNPRFADKFPLQITQVFVLTEEVLFFFLNQSDPADNLTGRRASGIKTLAVRADFYIFQSAQLSLGLNQMVSGNLKYRIGLLHFHQTNPENIRRFEFFFLTAVIFYRPVRIDSSPLNVTAHFPNPIVDAFNRLNHLSAGGSDSLRKRQNPIETIEILRIACLKIITKTLGGESFFEPLPLHLGFPETLIQKATEAVIDIGIKNRNIFSQNHALAVENISANCRKRLRLQNLLVCDGLPIFPAVYNLQTGQPD